MPEYPDAIPQVVLTFDPQHLLTAQLIGAAILTAIGIMIADAFAPKPPRRPW